MCRAQVPLIIRLLRRIWNKQRFFIHFFLFPDEDCLFHSVSGCDGGNRTRNIAMYNWRHSPLSSAVIYLTSSPSKPSWDSPFKCNWITKISDLRSTFPTLAIQFLPICCWYLLSAAQIPFKWCLISPGTFTLGRYFLSAVTFCPDTYLSQYF